MRISRDKLCRFMHERGVRTYTELASHIGITKGQLSRVLAYDFDPVKATVRNICDFLGVDPAEIMETDPDKCRNSHTDNKLGPTAIELFAGAGGISLGLEQAGFRTVEYVEIDKTCCDTLKHNRPEWNVVCEDIHNVDFTKYRGSVDVVTGGFPCQAFSYAGKKLGFEDTRGTLFHEFARCIQEVQPKMFWAENVRGLASHDHGRTLETILSVFESLGYTIGDRKRVLNACYYGVGQKRERIIIIGIRNDLAEKIHFEYPEPDARMTTLRDALAG